MQSAIGNAIHNRQCNPQSTVANRHCNRQSAIRSSIADPRISNSSYCVGLSNCLNVSVLMSRNIGVPGGSRVGLRKSVSNVQERSPRLYTSQSQHLKVPFPCRLV